MATSGSGTNATTHSHTLYEQTHSLAEDEHLQAGTPFDRTLSVNFPATDAWSLRIPSNVIEWTAEVRIDIPRCPDWTLKTVLKVVPPDFLQETFAAPIGQSAGLPELSAGRYSDTATPSAAGYEEFRSAPMTEDYGDEAVQNVGEGTVSDDEIGSLLMLIQRISAAGRFGNERSEIAAAASGHVYDVEILVDRVVSTFGFSGGDSRYNNGQTVTGKIANSDQDVQVFTTEATGGLLKLSRGDFWSTRATVSHWDSLYNRLVLLEVPMV